MSLRVLSFVAVAVALSVPATVALAEDGENNVIVTASESSGPAVSLPTDGESAPDTQYSSDSMGGIMASFGDGRFAVHPQVGFAKDGFGFDGAAAACAFGIGSPSLGYFSYQPRFLVGSTGDALSLGMRNAFAWHSAHDLFTMEIGHQFMSTNDSITMDVRGSVGFNAGGLFDLL